MADASGDDELEWVDCGEFEVMTPTMHSKEEPDADSADLPPVAAPPVAAPLVQPGSLAAVTRGSPEMSWAPNLGEAWPLDNDNGNVRNGGAPELARSSSRGLDARPSKEAFLELCNGLPAHLAQQDLQPAVPLLRRLYGWLWSGSAPEVQAWLLDSELHATLVGALAAPGRSGRGVAFWACHVIGRVACCHASNATALINAGAIDAISSLVEARRHDAEVHLASAYSLGYLAESGAIPASFGQTKALTGAVGRVLSAIEGLISDDAGRAAAS